MLFNIALIAQTSAQENWQLTEQHHDGVLGTSLDISIYSKNQADNEKVAPVMDLLLQEILRLENIFSSYQSSSEIMLLNSTRQTSNASKDLLTVLESCHEWYEKSDAKFSCRLGKVLELWDDAEETQVVPQRPDVRLLARNANQADLKIDPAIHKIELAQPINLETSGLAKGYIIDQALALLQTHLPDALAIKVDIGGDAVYWGVPPNRESWKIGVANPTSLADNTGYITHLALTSMAVAASGHTSRTRTIGRRKFSHIITPRDGWPIENGTSAIVVAPNAITADAIATALSVQPLIDGIEWVNTIDNVEALVVSNDGRQMVSNHWQDFLDADEPLSINAAPKLELSYVLPEFVVSSYNRPYVAIWITGLDQKAIKNLMLLGGTERWARENTRWWRRVGRRNPQLLDGVARATRGSGEYSLQWDGIDDFGQTVAPGEYILHLEASRENGGSSYQKIAFELGARPQSYFLKAEGELGDIQLTVKSNE